MIVLQVNVLKYDLGVTRGSCPDPGYDFVPRSTVNHDVILHNLLRDLKRKNFHRRIRNVNKLLNILFKSILSLTITIKDGTGLVELLEIFFRTTRRFIAKISNLGIFPINLVRVRTITEKTKLISDKIGISTAKMISLTIFLSLLKQNVESNPGMNMAKNDSFGILTYNCNGLGDKKKLKRLVTKLNPLVNKGCIIFLQETHLTDTTYLRTIWKNKLESNCVKSNSAGVIILYNNDYELVDSSKDSDGRKITVVIKNDNNKLILTNSYFPNDHKLGIIFAEAVYLKILEFQHKYPDYLTIAAGDYNLCMKTNDSLNRMRPNSEKLLSETIVSNNKITDLVDAYRYKHKDGGFTWNRGTCYSRLDYIFVSSSMLQFVSKAVHDWSFESSDHAAIMITFRYNEQISKGPGIVKINTAILDNPQIIKQIEEEVKLMMDQTDTSWNPHAKLEFFKVALRSVFSLKVSEIRKEVNLNIAETEEETNQMEDLKISIVKNVPADPDSQSKISIVDNAISALKIKLSQLRLDLSNRLAFKSRVKWFEYGEKSNKFFLNLLKCKQSQKLISYIKNGDTSYVGAQVIHGIREFYSNLYSAKIRQKPVNDNFYEHCPKLTSEQSLLLDSDLTLNDLSLALRSCKDSSPGPDGIPYMVYKKL